MSTEFILAWDIGGAHLKAAFLHINGRLLKTHQWATPVWKGLGTLDAAMKESVKLFQGLANTRQVATTTAELVDIFPDRGEGVRALTNKFTEFDNKILFYAGDKGFIGSHDTATLANHISSANWHATTSFVASKMNSGVMMDIGSTTTDIIPFQNGQPVNRGYSDHERLATTELVYSGMVRTPVMAMIKELNYRGCQYPLMAEHFANAADVHRLTGLLNENDDYMETADGADKSLQSSARRLARMIGIDFDETGDLNDIVLMAGEIADRQIDDLKTALKKNLSRIEKRHSSVLVGAGCGRVLVKQLATQLELTYRDFESLIDVEEADSTMAGNCATAVSLAHLARTLA